MQNFKQKFSKFTKGHNTVKTHISVMDLGQRPPIMIPKTRIKFQANTFSCFKEWYCTQNVYQSVTPAPTHE